MPCEPEGYPAPRSPRLPPAFVWILLASVLLSACGVVTTTWRTARGVGQATYTVGKLAVCATIETGKVVYRVGGYTFKVVTAPLTWPLTHEEVETIDGLAPREAIRQGRVKMSPYVVNGRRYVPMSLAEAGRYRESGVASWYGNETLNRKGGHMTANGEAFDPNELSAAHKYLPLPTYARVTNLQNGRTLIVRVNDRGPFVDGRIIDLSAAAARRLGFYEAGTARVRVAAIPVDG
ncbi:MAG: septal ring lytic transglycosylase RlpA family protein [Desulfobacterales bacterium]